MNSNILMKIPVRNNVCSSPLVQKLLAVMVLIAIAGCSHTGKLDIRLSEQVDIPEHPVIMFFADGVRTDVFDQMIDQGRLPNIKKYLIDRGSRVEYGISCIPSITYAVTASINTGRFPGHHGILGNRWFDRKTCKYQDYTYIRTYQQIDSDLRAPAIFEMLDDRYTITIQTANRLGAARPFDNWMSSGIYWFFKRTLQVDQLIALRFEEIAECAKKTGTWPDYILAYFPAIDEIGHRFGADTQEYRDAIVNFDKQVGRICRGLKRAGVYDKITFFLISDHGHAPADKDHTWLPSKFFRDKLGLNVMDHIFMEKASSDDRHAFLNKNYRVILINGGSRRVNVHLRYDDFWYDEPTYQQTRDFLDKYSPYADKFENANLMQVLADQPAVRIVTAQKSPDEIEIFYRDEKALVQRQLDKGRKTYRYTPQTGDPLDYKQHNSTAELIDGKFHSADRWLDASCDTHFPDFVPQIVEMYDSHRSGQIVFFAQKGWDFSETDLGGHGSVLEQDMIVPFVVAGPNITNKNIKTARLVDIVPTILDIMNISPKLQECGPIDGKSILPELKATKDMQSLTE